MGIRIEKPLKFRCDKVCENCVIRFKCWTQRGITELSIEDLNRIEEVSK